jgi:hypothetical protein
LKRAQLTDEGIVFNQSKTGAGVLVEWTDELRKITDRAKALKPQVPGEYLLRKRNGRPFLWREKHVGCAARANNSAGLITICRPDTLRQPVGHGHTTFHTKAATNAYQTLSYRVRGS